jgi:short subunit dehydrogenase-like uncharacterized protein
MPKPQWLIYGANGYTGRRIAEEAAARGWQPILAGRRGAEIAALAQRLRCAYRVFPLDDPPRLAEGLKDVSAVLHCAGPFSATGEPMMDGCLRAGVNYLDITGEIAVIEAAAARGPAAVEAGVTLLPSTGFDVVPSDCLAAMLAERLPGATRLQLAFSGGGRIGPGTARTIVEGLRGGGRVRIDGRIAAVPVAWKTIHVELGGVRREAATIPWGDVATAWYTTGIPNIEVYAVMPHKQIVVLRRLRPVLAMLRLPGIGRPLGRTISSFLTGRTQSANESSRSSFWGRVSDEHGRAVTATLETIEGYRLTVLTSLAAVDRVLGGGVPHGFVTPARALGSQFILGIPETEIRWGPETSS